MGNIFVSLKYLFARLKLLWTFAKMVPDARVLELEIQEARQKFHNTNFANDLSQGRYDLEKARTEGYCKGIEWCLKRFS